LFRLSLIVQRGKLINELPFMYTGSRIDGADLMVLRGQKEPRDVGELLGVVWRAARHGHPLSILAIGLVGEGEPNLMAAFCKRHSAVDLVHRAARLGLLMAHVALVHALADTPARAQSVFSWFGRGIRGVAFTTGTLRGMCGSDGARYAAMHEDACRTGSATAIAEKALVVATTGGAAAGLAICDAAREQSLWGMFQGVAAVLGSLTLGDPVPATLLECRALARERGLTQAEFWLTVGPLDADRGARARWLLNDAEDPRSQATRSQEGRPPAVRALAARAQAAQARAQLGYELCRMGFVKGRALLREAVNLGDRDAPMLLMRFVGADKGLVEHVGEGGSAPARAILASLQMGVRQRAKALASLRAFSRFDALPLNSVETIALSASSVISAVHAWNGLGNVRKASRYARIMLVHEFSEPEGVRAQVDPASRLAFRLLSRLDCVSPFLRAELT
jgi:hypothetical protein